MVATQLETVLIVNHRSCRKIRQSVASRLLVCTALTALALPIRAHAQFTGKASATGQFESNSNVFSLESNFTQPGTGYSRPPRTQVSGSHFLFDLHVSYICLVGLQPVRARGAAPAGIDRGWNQHPETVAVRFMTLSRGLVRVAVVQNGE
jgi:hypothetical protein